MLAQRLSWRPILRYHALPRLVPGVYVLWLLREYHLWRDVEDLCRLTSVEVSELLSSDRVERTFVAVSVPGRILYISDLYVFMSMSRVTAYRRFDPLHPLPCASLIPLAAISGAIRSTASTTRRYKYFSILNFQVFTPLQFINLFRPPATRNHPTSKQITQYPI